MVDREFCWFHDPELAARRKDASAAGGKAKKPAVRGDAPSISLRSLSDMFDLNENIVNMLDTNQIDHQSANSITYLATIGRRALKLKAEELRIGNLERLGQLDGGADTATEPDVESERSAGVDGSRVRLRGIDDILKLIEDTIGGVLSDQVHPRRANAIGSAANAQLGLISIELAERKARLEASEENRLSQR